MGLPRLVSFLHVSCMRLRESEKEHLKLHDSKLGMLENLS